MKSTAVASKDSPPDGEESTAAAKKIPHKDLFDGLPMPQFLLGEKVSETLARSRMHTCRRAMLLS